MVGELSQHQPTPNIHKLGPTNWFLVMDPIDDIKRYQIPSCDHPGWKCIFFLSGGNFFLESQSFELPEIFQINQAIIILLSLSQQIVVIDQNIWSFWWKSQRALLDIRYRKYLKFGREFKIIQLRCWMLLTWDNKTESFVLVVVGGVEVLLKRLYTFLILRYHNLAAS